ncbi:hypothetical protein HQ560_05495, partial [bacterium]|nr:hypothetical protein [bacterium]
MLRKPLALVFLSLACLASTASAEGVIVHLGAENTEGIVDMVRDRGGLLQIIDTDVLMVRKVEYYAKSMGLLGRVSATTFDGAHLPYVNNLVSLFIAPSLGAVPLAEVMRVLQPGGVAVIGGQVVDENGKPTVKPWPKAIDNWTHYLHDATNNAVARDTVVGPP